MDMLMTLSANKNWIFQNAVAYKMVGHYSGDTLPLG